MANWAILRDLFLDSEEINWLFSPPSIDSDKDLFINPVEVFILHTKTITCGKIPGEGGGLTKPEKNKLIRYVPIHCSILSSISIVYHHLCRKDNTENVSVGTYVVSLHFISICSISLIAAQVKELNPAGLSLNPILLEGNSFDEVFYIISIKKECFVN